MSVPHEGSKPLVRRAIFDKETQKFDDVVQSPVCVAFTLCALFGSLRNGNSDLCCEKSLCENQQMQTKVDPKMLRRPRLRKDGKESVAQARHLLRNRKALRRGDQAMLLEEQTQGQLEVNEIDLQRARCQQE